MDGQIGVMPNASVAEAIARLRHLGYAVWAEGDRIRASYRAEGEPPLAAQRLIDLLRDRKAEALLFLDREGWPPESLEYEARFGQRSARLYPFLGQRVWTPEGPGKLLQVFEARCVVLLDDRPEATVEVPAVFVRPLTSEVANEPS